MGDNCSEKIVDILHNLKIDGVAGGTDKNFIHSYTDVYGKHLNKFLNEKGSLLEIGVRFGGSALLWHELLPNFKLCLVDNCNLFNIENRSRMDSSRFNYIVDDAYLETTKDNIKKIHPEGFDVITDDGPHTLESQIDAIKLYLDLLKDDGVFIIEDILFENLDNIIQSIPPDYTYEKYDLRDKKGRYDDVALVIRKNKMNKKCKIVMTTMFKNEAKVIRRMLDSCYKYIDYAVIQNNGSTDGTDQIVREFFEEKQIPLHLYDVEEGWVGFGWNRDHLTQTCQKVDHGCDWILKMDCDEVLEVDDDFDWSPLDDKSIQSFHIAAVAGSCIYYRAWMWNARLPWRFNHDPCHETIYLDDGVTGEAFQRYDLSTKIRQIGYNEGQSWSNPTKFISDALILEEKMIKENSFHTNPYHFWYIGKSYYDAYQCHAFPLGLSQQKEFAKRCTYYFREFMEFSKAQGVDEMCYMASIFGADGLRFVGETDQAIEMLVESEKYGPERNDHLFGLAFIYNDIQNWDAMLEVTSKMMQPERTNPFPKYVVMIDRSMYHDGGTRVKELYDIACDKTGYKPKIYINTNMKKKLFVVDDFYANPDEVRQIALAAEYKRDIRYYKGQRSGPYRFEGLKEAFESIIGEKINNWEAQDINGCFQIVTAEDPQVYHHDLQKWAAMIYLTPNAPVNSGTRLHRSRINGTMHMSDDGINDAFSGGFYDASKFDTIADAGNLYNRLVIMDAQNIHSAGNYFGQDNETGRLTHLFFFD